VASNDDSDSMVSDYGKSDIDSVDGGSAVSWDGSVGGQSNIISVYGDNKGPSNKVRRGDVSQTYLMNHQNHHRFIEIAKKNGRNLISPALRAKKIMELMFALYITSLHLVKK
jgi:hypothetical protein